MKKIKIVFFLLLITTSVTSCGPNSSNNEGSGNSYAEVEQRPLTEEELKQQLIEKECSIPAEYLDGTLKYTPIYKNILSMKVKGLKLKCQITNKATLAIFKDIKARVEFISKTGAIILEREFDIYEFIAPKSSIEYKTEVEITNQQFKDIENFNWTIVKASCK